MPMTTVLLPFPTFRREYYHFKTSRFAMSRHSCGQIHGICDMVRTEVSEANLLTSGSILDALQENRKKK